MHLNSEQMYDRRIVKLVFYFIQWFAFNKWVYFHWKLLFLHANDTSMQLLLSKCKLAWKHFCMLKFLNSAHCLDKNLEGKEKKGRGRGKEGEKIIRSFSSLFKRDNKGEE